MYRTLSITNICVDMYPLLCWSPNIFINMFVINTEHHC